MGWGGVKVLLPFLFSFVHRRRRTLRMGLARSLFFSHPFLSFSKCFPDYAASIRSHFERFGQILHVVGREIGGRAVKRTAERMEHFG